MLILDIFISLGIIYLIVYLIYLSGNKKIRYIDTYLSSEKIHQYKVKYKVSWFYYGSLLIAFDAMILLITMTALSLNILTLFFLGLIMLSLLFIPKEVETNA